MTARATEDSRLPEAQRQACEDGFAELPRELA